jgi:hypothetical protein
VRAGRGFFGSFATPSFSGSSGARVVPDCRLDGAAAAARARLGARVIAAGLSSTSRARFISSNS